MKGGTSTLKDSSLYGYVLFVLLTLFFLRVLGHVIVVVFHPRWLPPMSQWYSGLMPYRFLVPIQFAMLLFMGLVCVQFIRGEGVFVIPHPHLGQGVIGFSAVYFLSMVVRYVVRMTRHPDQRWLGGTIPIIFHCVLATFLYVFGRYHAH